MTRRESALLVIPFDLFVDSLDKAAFLTDGFNHRKRTRREDFHSRTHSIVSSAVRSKKFSVLFSSKTFCQFCRGVESGVFAESDIDLLVESVDEEVKHLLFGEFVGCLVRSHQPTKQPVHLTRFVRY
jgi:hypothetical protein